MLALGDGTAVQVPVSDSADVFRSQVSTAVSLLSAQRPTIASSAITSAGLLKPTTTSASVQQSGSSHEQPVVSTVSKFTHVVECGTGDADRVTTSHITYFTPRPGSRGDTHKPVGIDSTSFGSVSSTFQSISFPVPQSQVVVAASARSSANITQPEATHSSSLPPKVVESVSLPATHKVASGTKSVVENVPSSMSRGTPSAVSSVSQSHTSSSGNLGSLTSFTPTGGFAPVFGNLNPTTSSSSSNLSLVQHYPSLPSETTTSTAPQQPRTQPAVSTSSNPVTIGGFANQPSFPFSAVASDQFAAPSAAVIPSTSGAAVTQLSLTQSASSGVGLSFEAPATTAFGSSTIQSFGKDQNTPIQFGSFPVQPSLSSLVSSTNSSASSGLAPSVVPFGNFQQPSFRPVFGNPNSQQAMPGFGSFPTVTAVPSFTGQPPAGTTTQPSSSNVLQTSGNQPASASVGGFPASSAGANPFGVSAFQSGSSFFGGSVPKSDNQSTSSSFGSFTSVSSGSLFGNSTVPSGSTTFGCSVTRTDSQTTSSAFGTPAGGHSFGGSTVQLGPNAFGNTSAPKSNSQPNSNSFGGFTGISTGTTPFGSATAFGNSNIQQGSTGFGGSLGAVFNVKPSAAPTSQQSLPNGFHKSSASVGPFAFIGKSDQTPSGASPFNFGQSTNNVGGVSMSSPVPVFGCSTPASSFTFGKPAFYHLQ